MGGNVFLALYDFRTSFVVVGAGGGEDPDPTPYLVVSMEMKREAMAKPYDSKKSVWCPDGSGGFSEALLESDDGKKATVTVGHEVDIKPS